MVQCTQKTVGAIVASGRNTGVALTMAESCHVRRFNSACVATYVHRNTQLGMRELLELRLSNALTFAKRQVHQSQSTFVEAQRRDRSNHKHV